VAKDPTQVLFDRRRILEVELEMTSGDWEALRSQTRTVQSIRTVWRSTPTSRPGRTGEVGRNCL
jgi:hypothetical protein